MYKYELGTIIACESLSEEETQTIIGQIRELISECHGRIIKEDLWGQKELAYPIKKQNHGFYMFTLVNFESHEVPLFENKLRLLDGCLRYLLINLDKEPGYNEQQEIDSHKEAVESTESVSTEQPTDTAESTTVEEETKPKPEKKTKTTRKTTPKEKSAAPKEKPAKTIDSEESDKKDDVVSEEKPAEPAPKAEDKKAKAENLDKILDEIL